MIVSSLLQKIISGESLYYRFHKMYPQHIPDHIYEKVVKQLNEECLQTCGGLSVVGCFYEKMIIDFFRETPVPSSRRVVIPKKYNLGLFLYFMKRAGLAIEYSGDNIIHFINSGSIDLIFKTENSDELCLWNGILPFYTFNIRTPPLEPSRPSELYGYMKLLEKETTENLIKECIEAYAKNIKDPKYDPNRIVISITTNHEKFNEIAKFIVALGFYCTYTCDGKSDDLESCCYFKYQLKICPTE